LAVMVCIEVRLFSMVWTRLSREKGLRRAGVFPQRRGEPQW
jgi:hypothetical protein